MVSIVKCSRAVRGLGESERDVGPDVSTRGIYRGDGRERYRYCTGVGFPELTREENCYYSIILAECSGMIKVQFGSREQRKHRNSAVPRVYAERYDNWGKRRTCQ